MTTNGYLVEAPPGVDPMSVVNRFDRNQGWATVVAAPRAATAFDLDRALLANITDTTAGGAVPFLKGTMLRHYTSAWITGWGIRNVALYGAAEATGNQWGRLHQWADDRGFTLHIIVDHGDLNTLTGRNLYTTPTGWHDWVNTLPKPADKAPLEAAHDTYRANRAASQQHTALPHADWPTFLHTCRNTLPADQYRSVWTEYVDAHTQAAATRAQDTDIRRTLDRLLLTTPDTDTVITRLRGAQAGFFTNGIAVTVNTDRLLGCIYRLTKPEFTDAHWALLRRHHQPTKAAACALYMNGHNRDTIGKTTCAHITEALHTGHLHGIPVDPRARPYLLALDTYRNEKRTAPDDTAISGQPSHISGWLVETRRLHGIPFAFGKRINRPEGLDSVAAVTQLLIRFLPTGADQ